METLLVLSDVHLGSDLNDLGKPIPRSPRVDVDLVRLITHYRTVAAPGARWHLIVAGDFIDFVGTVVRAEGVELATERSNEEREHGLGSAVDHVRLKLQRIVERHREVFDALGGFVADGHALSFIHGNHDLEFYWDAVKRDLRSLLLARGSAARNGAVDGDAFEARIAFHPWFFYVPGIVYIEHGHQYDPFCASQFVMAPLSARDPRRLARSVADVLLRFVVRPTRGMHEYGHDRHGVSYYLAFGAKLGAVGLWQLARRYACAVGELFRLRREQLSAATRRPREEHERAMAGLAGRTELGASRMRALAALQATPANRTIAGILASVLLDRLALGVAALFLLFVVVALTTLHVANSAWAGPTIALAWALGHRHLARRRSVDPGKTLIERASSLAALFPAAFVVMGHTHEPVKMPIRDGRATYINLGSWSEEEGTDRESPVDPRDRAARTHLVLCNEPKGPVAHLLAWDEDGPRSFGRA